MTLFVFGISHQSAPLAVRERVAMARERVADAIAGLRRQPGVQEALILSTCNRTEIYFTGEIDCDAAVREWLHADRNLDGVRLQEYFYQFSDLQAARHLFRVATGLDSMVLGEPQILGQVKQAYHLAKSAGGLADRLERLCQNAFAVAKHVRTHTRIGASPVSVAFAAVRLAQQIFADLRNASALLIGAGDTIELAAKHLKQAGLEHLVIANRTLANAQALAERFEGLAIPLSDLHRQLPAADIVIASTASPQTIIDRAMVQQALRERRHKPMLIVDLAVPRDVDAAVAGLNDVFLYTVDDLGDVIAEGLQSRREAAREADAIIDLHAEHYLAWCRARRHQGVLQQLRADAQDHQRALLHRAKQMLASGKPAEEVLEFLAHALANRLLHRPSAQLRAAAMRNDLDLLRAAEQLFGDAQTDPSATDHDSLDPP